MKDEIKEILNYFINYMSIDDCIRLSKIEDYITNLQEENERLKIEKQEEYNCFNLMAKFRDKALTRELIYKSRNEKAIEYINKYYSDETGEFTYQQYCIHDDLLNILQGEDKDD